MLDSLLSELFNQNIILFHMINHGMGNVLLDFIMPLITNLGSFLAWIIICVLLFLFGGGKFEEGSNTYFSCLIFE